MGVVVMVVVASAELAVEFGGGLGRAGYCIWTRGVLSGVFVVKGTV